MHERNIIHRDIKPENVLLETGFVSRVLLADFGLAVALSTDPARTFCGTINYLAPEVFSPEHRKRGYREKVDCWAAGVLMYAMLSGLLPFCDDDNEVLAEQIQRQEPVFCESDFAGVSPEAIDLMLALLRKDPEQRISIKDALQHPWFAVSPVDTSPPKVLTDPHTG